jgi:phospholipase A1
MLIATSWLHGAEDSTSANAGRFSMYKDNYFLLTSVNNFRQVKFQFSLKYRLIDGSGFFVGYTQKSFWNAWGFAQSSPFQENNYNPELNYDFSVAPVWNIRRGIIGIEHESNGRDSLLTRWWNRLYAQEVFSLDESSHVTFRLKAWIPFIVSRNNSDIREFLGNAEAELRWHPLQRHDLFELALEIKKGNNFELKKSGIQGDLIIKPFELLNANAISPFNASLYLQYYYGYGESLETYNTLVQRFGIGFILVR